jgi:hypothetical protein
LGAVPENKIKGKEIVDYEPEEPLQTTMASA